MTSHPRTKLAILGGSPEFSEVLHVGRPNLGDRERFFRRVDEILDRRWLTNDGPLVREFESRLCSLLQVKNVIAVANATLALEIAARAADVSGEAIVPSFTFIATAHALQWQQVTPVFCDTAPDSHHIDPAAIAALLSPRTTAIMAVHVWGHPCDVRGLESVAEEHGLKLIFDAAHALGCTWEGKMIGGFGDCEVFSFHATKFINAFEGGAIATNDDALATRMRLMRNFGFSGYDRVDCVGLNAKMSEVHAAMGITSLEAMPQIVATNRENYLAYRAGLGEIPGLELFEYDERETNNYQYVIVTVDEATTKVSRDLFVRVLQAENVMARRYFFPGCHQMEPYATLTPDAARALPNTERLTRRVMSLPNGTAVTPSDVTRICGLLRRTLECHSDLRGI